MSGFKIDGLKKDENYKGSIFEKLELSEYICPFCGAHLKEVHGDLICLNACHLPKRLQEKFHGLMEESYQKIQMEKK